MGLMVDKYFEKTAHCCDPETTATYGVFLRHDVVCAILPAIGFLADSIPGIEITRHYPEGAFVPAEKCLFSYSGKLKELVVLETKLLMHVGVSCISAHNAYQMALACKKAAFLDMHARHAAGEEMVMLAAYGASVGSKSAMMQGATGFIGSSLDQTAGYFGTSAGLGTMPHVLIGLAGSTVDAVKLFIDKNPDDRNIVALVDYYGQEVTDSLMIAEYFDHHDLWAQGYKLGIRLDTHGARFCERLDWDKSVHIMEQWLHVEGEYPIVRHVMGESTFEIASGVKDRVRAYLFGTGVSAANIINLRTVLNAHGHNKVTIVASSGFNLLKCRIMAQVNAPIDVIGTGSFLPETLSETYATADAYKYNGHFSVKVGREHIFKGL
jgi:nicotinate phosphoribosyltransferase